MSASGGEKDLRQILTSATPNPIQAGGENYNRGHVDLSMAVGRAFVP